MDLPRKPKTKRSPKWAALEKKLLAAHPYCAVCGHRIRKQLRGHHIIPVHVDPARELDPANVVILCQGDTVNCHLLFGHLLNWDSWNEYVAKDAAAWNTAITHRPLVGNSATDAVK